MNREEGRIKLKTSKPPSGRVEALKSDAMATQALSMQRTCLT